MAEMSELETVARKTVTDLCFQHKRFNEVDISSFAREHGWQAALMVMKECLAENAKREKKHLQAQNEGSMFKQRARKYAGRQQDEQHQQEWVDYTETVKAEAAGVTPTSKQLREKLQDALDAGYISQEQYATGMGFLDSVDRRKGGEKDEAGTEPEKTEVE